ncbi:MAG: hypothetical protein J6W29_05795 [Neisseriaceae bacterium]|nr:hypothetical protein [Neisseriaceae bacterium]
MNDQDKRNNTHALSKSALVKLPECNFHGTKKQRITRILLGGGGASVALSMAICFLWGCAWMINEPLAVITILFLFLLFIVPSIIFSAIIEYLPMNCVNKVAISLITGAGFAILYFVLHLFDREPLSSNSLIILSKWFISGEFAVLIGLFIMQKHRIHCEYKI